MCKYYVPYLAHSKYFLKIQLFLFYHYYLYINTFSYPFYFSSSFPYPLEGEQVTSNHARKLRSVIWSCYYNLVLFNRMFKSYKKMFKSQRKGSPPILPYCTTQPGPSTLYSELLLSVKFYGEQSMQLHVVALQRPHSVTLILSPHYFHCFLFHIFVSMYTH